VVAHDLPPGADRGPTSSRRTMIRLLGAAFLVASSASAQIGGNGSDGVLTPSTDITLDTTNNGGLFQFTTIAIPVGVTVKLRGPNAARLLCQGSVEISGTLDADAGAAPGPGGWDAGWQTTGEGPGGGSGPLQIYGGGGDAAHATVGVSPGFF